MADKRLELPQGTLDLLILKAVALEPLHGWAISQNGYSRFRTTPCRCCRAHFTPPCTAWNAADGSRQSGPSARITAAPSIASLLPKGERQLETETAAWRKLTRTVDHILDMA
jgi:hypothetical protein